jgi:CRP-like cAMP-binding protein
LANLKVAGKASAAQTHGAFSEELIRGSASAYLAELSREFPGASERVLRLQARRLAKLDRLASYLEGRGEIRNRRTGEVFAASALEERITAAYLVEHARLQEGERGGPAPHQALDAIVAEITAGKDGANDV